MVREPLHKVIGRSIDTTLRQCPVHWVVASQFVQLKQKKPTRNTRGLDIDRQRNVDLRLVQRSFQSRHQRK